MTLKKSAKQNNISIKVIIGLLSLIFVFSLTPGCVYEKEEILYPPPACDTSGITYSQDVVAILSTNCYRCHSTANSPSLGAGIVLDEYHELKHHVEDGDLVGVINHAPGYPQMPKDAAKLSDCDIDKIEAWVNAGALEN